MTTTDTLICSLQIGTNQLVTEAKQFDAVVRDPIARREAAQLLEDTIVALTKIGCRLDPAQTHRSLLIPA